MIKSQQLLGIRLVVGQQTLDLYAVVRIHDPQPIFLGVVKTTPFLCVFGIVFVDEGIPTISAGCPTPILRSYQSLHGIIFHRMNTRKQIVGRVNLHETS